jgi:Branched-chain amino acid transport protein (AzlD)
VGVADAAGSGGAAATVALLLAAAAMLALRGAGMLLAGTLRPDHPFIRWAASVSQAVLAAFVTLAVIAPTGALATLPLPARLLALGAALAAHTASGGRVLPSLGAGLAVLLAARALL